LEAQKQLLFSKMSRARPLKQIVEKDLRIKVKEYKVEEI
jgi:hypothetical protein